MAPPTRRARSALRNLQAPVILITGEYDVGGHCPWIDDPEWLVETMSAFLR